MFEKGVPVEIYGKRYNLVFTVAAMIEISKRYGGISEMIVGMGITEVPDGTDEEGNEITKQVVDDKKMLPEVPWIVALLANQGTFIESGSTKPDNPNLITEEYVSTFTLPYQFKDLMGAVMEAIALGNGMEHQPKNAEPAI